MLKKLDLRRDSERIAAKSLRQQKCPARIIRAILKSRKNA